MPAFQKRTLIRVALLINGILGWLIFSQSAVAAGDNSSIYAALRQDSGVCRYIDPDGGVSGELQLSLSECAKAIVDESARLGEAEGYGFFDDYALYVLDNGDVYAAEPDYFTPINQLNWSYLGNIFGNSNSSTAQASAQPETTTTQSGGDARSQAQGTVPSSLEQIFQIAAEDINDFWVETFKEYGYDYAEPEVVLFSRSQVSSGCGVAPAQVGPFYCNIDHTMYFPYGFMERQWERFGDYAVVTIIAHEWGHAIQNLLGGLDSGDYTITIELEADCFAGAYTQYANERSQKIRLEESDIEEGSIALFNAADPSGTPWWDPQAHGTGEQRSQAFLDGFENGVTVCGA